jgi:hypothetical protein
LQHPLPILFAGRPGREPGVPQGANAVLSFAALCSVTLSNLMTRK